MIDVIQRSGVMYGRHAAAIFVALIAYPFLFPRTALANETGDENSRMNIVLFLIDDLGWRDLTCQGSDFYQTPNIDRLAEEGVRFTNAYAACAVCSPTRAAIMTGKYPARLMLTEWLPSGRWNPYSKLKSGRYLRSLPSEEVTLAEALQDAGYQTGHVGKWHLGDDVFSSPIHHGFDWNAGGNPHGAPGSYFFPYRGNWLVPKTKQRAKWEVFVDGVEGEYLTDRLTSEAVKFITDHQADSFFLHFSHYGVHTPLQAKESMVAKYQDVAKSDRQGSPVYAAMVESIDQSVGRVVKTLQDLALEDNTVILFTSDNGGFYKATNNSPLRANKGAYYEGGIRVPLIVKWPGKSKPGRVLRDPVTSTDLYPTCLAMAGIPQKPHQHLDGLNLESVIGGQGNLPTRSLFWHYPHYNSHPSSVPSSVIRRGDWKLIETYDPAGVELYHLGQDLSESRSLVSKHPGRVKEMLQELSEWRVSVKAETMDANPDYDPSKL